MPNWSEVLEEIAKVASEGGHALDVVRRKYLSQIQNYTGRNTIAYYSGWLQRPYHQDTAVNDKDVSGFMLNIHKLDRSKGLDLILHTPGGDVTATEALVRYLKKMFGPDIRAIVPQLSMSAGTMIAFACKEVIMGKHSSLGPIDPQMGGMPCQAVLAEFDKARQDIVHDPNQAALWQFIISKYHPTFLGSCHHAVTLTNDLVREWLMDNMCKGDQPAMEKILKLFSSHDDSKTHARHIMVDQCQGAGVRVVVLESDAPLQDLVLTTHHAFMHTFTNTGAVKIIENHLGIAYIEQLPPEPAPRP